MDFSNFLPMQPTLNSFQQTNQLFNFSQPPPAPITADSFIPILPNGTINPSYLQMWSNITAISQQLLQTNALMQTLNCQKLAEPVNTVLPDCNPVTGNQVLEGYKPSNFVGTIQKNSESLPDGIMIRFAMCQDTVFKFGLNALNYQDRMFYNTYQNWIGSVWNNMSSGTRKEDVNKTHPKAGKEKGVLKGIQKRPYRKTQNKKIRWKKDEEEADIEEIVLT